MGSPSRNSLAVSDPVLSNFSLEFSQAGFVSSSGSAFGLTGDFIFPRVRHNLDGLTGEYYTYNTGNRFTLPASALIKRANGTQYHAIDWDVSSGTYKIEDYGLEKSWDDNEQSAQMGPIDLNRDSTQVLTDLVMLAYETRINAIVTNSSTITQTSTAAALNGQWDSAGSNPIKDVNTAVSTIYQATGVRPNKMVVGWDAWIDGLMNNDEIIARINAGNNMGGNEDITPQLVGQRLFNLDLRVNTGILNSAVEGQTVSLSTSATNMFGTNALIFYSDPNPNIKSRTIGSTFHTDWMRVFRWNVQPKMHTVAVSTMTAEELVSASLGYLITSCTS